MQSVTGYVNSLVDSSRGMLLRFPWPTINGKCGAVRAIEYSQMPRHLIGDAHEWINDIPTVPIYYIVKPLSRERAWKNAATQR